MSDTKITRVNGVLLYLTGSYTSIAAWTNHTSQVVYGGNVYVSATDIGLDDMPSLSMGMGDEGCTIKNLPVGSQALANNIRNRYPYPEIGVLVYSFLLDGAGVPTGGQTWTIFSGLVYSAQAHLKRDYISIEAKGDKYYTDRIAGVTCLEQCVVAYFGDALCQKAVHSETIDIATISGMTVGFSSKPSGVNFLYRSGYLSYQGLEIKIVDWNDTPGTSATTVTVCPTAWIGATVTIFAGCDRTYETCDIIHSNLDNILPLGRSMVDYNTYFEEA